MASKKDIFTVPNALSFLRLLLIPLFAVLYLTGHTVGAIVCLGISTLSDFLDGKLARKLNQVTELGILLDPVADKFTQGTIVICLGIRYPILWWMLGIQVIKEGFMVAAGLITLKKRGIKFHKAAWFGKVGTGITDATLLALLIFPSMPENIRTLLVCFCSLCMVITLLLYVREYVFMWRQPIPPEEERATLI